MSRQATAAHGRQSIGDAATHEVSQDSVLSNGNWQENSHHMVRQVHEDSLDNVKGFNSS